MSGTSLEYAARTFLHTLFRYYATTSRKNDGDDESHQKNIDWLFE